MHRTETTPASGHTPAHASCKCGWTYQGGGWYRCLLAAQRHRFDALERGEHVEYNFPAEATPPLEVIRERIRARQDASAG